MKRVALVVDDGFQLLDLAGPADVFEVANQVLGHHVYAIEVLSSKGGVVTASNGVAVTTTRLAGARRVQSGRTAARDTLIVVSGWPTARQPMDASLVNGVAAVARRSRRVASVCSGAFVLADLVATNTFMDLPEPDVVLVPGGPGTERALADQSLLQWLTAAHERSTWTTSVCSGSLILGAAGILKDKPATCHWGWRQLLPLFGAIPVDGRMVVEGKVVTAAGVSAGIDMALSLLGQAADESTARTVQLAIEYDPQPPFDSGDANRADESQRQAALALIR